MSLGFGILGFLNYGPMSGYDLVKAFESSLQFFWHAQNSQIYLELKKLEKKGYIDGETVIQSDRPNKKIFSITEAGKRAFMDWLAKGAEEDATHFKSAFLMKVFFGGNMPPAQSADMLRKFKADCETYLEKMGETPDSIGKYGSNKEKYQTLYWQFTVDFGYCFIKTCIEWAARCIQKLENLENEMR
ncbi:PadR family transcriptional regulator [bacterium 1xD8-6]|jgi:Predicted transcriptional regulators|nr:PadR family transcriptional regulator [bacterium D16-36]RKI72379.1 PadR family transcriptional regulator [bacterium 1xD8-6]